MELNNTAHAPLLDIQHVTYAYPLQKTQAEKDAPSPAVLRDVSLQIRQGEYIALLGHNGSGKSTLARLCNALLLPDRGRVLVAGQDTRDATQQQAIRQQIGMVFQNPDNQIIATVVEDDAAWSLALQGFPATLIRERVDAALAAVGLEHARHQMPHQLSGGQRQRLAIAGILALRPRCIIADEATSMLDPSSRQDIVALLSRLHREFGLTIIHVTHLLEEVVQAQRIVLMEQGQIVQEGTPATIWHDIERLRALKLIIPDTFTLTTRLRAAGFPLSAEAVTIDAIEKGLIGAESNY
ncbi:energy-coupling factor transporter ATP-binding protein EcfA1 [Dictyobacter sp. S3.2.2.5]|uniref:Energy-coupling factor transporter ATP-binding protein EcfA1 n=1 Tax=Dictyobacter halimunensis TaxID=3026934 RepID=A0ABQ6FJA0_9CHLR|nr:energy-coupling factor transporter ATP-binding protein EcfA1 [Dictyobacter sp. S3.2.2.5]